MWMVFVSIPIIGLAQQKDTVTNKADSLKSKGNGIIIKKDSITTPPLTTIRGQVLDAASHKPLSFIEVAFIGSSYGTQTDDQGEFELSAPASFGQVKFSFIGYKSVIKTITPGQIQPFIIYLEGSKTQLKEVVIHAGKKPRYRNKDNPAVELIQQVIDHKESNRMLSADYLQYDQYERIGFSLFDLSNKFLKGKAFSKYRFLLDTGMTINDSVKTTLPVYMSEKYFKFYSRKNPAKTINILTAHKEVNFSAFLDTAGLDIYLNRIYGNPDIYANNIFILTNQFLSPIADHARDFYKFFITDTIGTGKDKLIEISFTPRNLGDLLFEGKLYITTDGRYAVKSDYMKINKHININFVRRMDIRQDFQQYPDGRFYLIKSDVQSDFGLMRNNTVKIFGDRTVFFSNYKSQAPQPPQFYEGNAYQISPDANQTGNDYWLKHRADTLRPAQAQVYHHIDSLEQMPSFKRTMWWAQFITGGYADAGAVQLGPNENVYSFNNLEGSRISIGGRTTPLFNKSFYLEGYTAYGFKDQREKYYLGGIYSFNQTPTWRYPNDYLRVSYQYDTSIPGQNFLIDKAQSVLSSFTRGTSDLWQYNRIFKADYVKDLENHVSFDLGLKHWNQAPADSLKFQPATGPAVNSLTTTELGLTFRYAPHEQIFQGTDHRHSIPSKYPIFTVQANYGMKGVWGGSYNYLNLSANIYKRFYLSQLGYTDVTLLGGAVLGQVPFPYLAILPANQTYVYDHNAYNDMNFMEFVSDHYVGLNITHAFGGFLLNKIPVLSNLKLREYLSFKILYGGLRNENNPAYHPELYKFPINPNGTALTYPLGNTPYIEMGAGIGNIFKVIRVDAIRRFDYLNHPGVTPYGLRFSFTPDL
ncbi:MAG: hypothetical protein JWP45_1 [Mucilaginibacter sp.]|nr:hypothetical protein [Mucilaginibacter sp.]